MLLAPLPFLAIFEYGHKRIIKFSLTRYVVIFEKLVDDFGFQQKSPLLILKVRLFWHSVSGCFLDHVFNSIWMETVEDPPEEFSLWVLIPFPVRKMVSHSIPVIYLGQDILDRKLWPIGNRLGWNISLSQSTFLSEKNALKEYQLAFRKLWKQESTYKILS